MPERRRPDRLRNRGEYSSAAESSSRRTFRATGPRAAAITSRCGGRDLWLSTTGGIPMRVSLLEWAITMAATTAVLVFDVVIMARRVGEPTMRRSALALSAYIGLAGCFGIWTWCFHGKQFAVQFFAGWLTEYSLSIDNLF